MRARLVMLVALALACEPARAAVADQRYSVSGADSYVIGAGDIHSDTTYQGSETLTTKRQGRATRYKASITYVRTEQGEDTPANGDFITDLLPDGRVLDSANRDPDYLTVLNQPFSVQLDAATLAGLRVLRGTIPFDFASPISGSSLHGRLERIAAGAIGPHQALGVRFEAGGPMRGALAERPGLVLIGTIVLRGTAYYDLDSALLLALDATVTISGKLSNRNGADPVTIVYHRTIRAVEPAQAKTARSSTAPPR
jgi:hypothetical protein